MTPSPEVLDHAAMLAHDLAGQPRHMLHQQKGGFLARGRGKGRETDHIGEQDRDLTTLGFHGRSPPGWMNRISTELVQSSRTLTSETRSLR
jgi:hypothetical protein